jgi:hypothetical protein
MRKVRLLSEKSNVYWNSPTLSKKLDFFGKVRESKNPPFMSEKSSLDLGIFLMEKSATQQLWSCVIHGREHNY